MISLVNIYALIIHAFILCLGLQLKFLGNLRVANIATKIQITIPHPITPVAA